MAEEEVLNFAPTFEESGADSLTNALGNSLQAVTNPDSWWESFKNIHILGDTISVGYLLPELGRAIIETFLMCSFSLLLAVIIGLPLGFLLFLTRRDMLLESRLLNFAGGLIINVVRSLPFLILLILLIPVSQFIARTSIGWQAAIFPLALASITFYARLVESSLCEVDSGVLESAKSYGASNWLIIKAVLLPESLPGLVRGFVMTAVSLIGYSAMAGVIGAGGVGFLAINYGYYRYETGVMLVTVILLILLVQAVQAFGDKLANSTEEKKK